MDRDILHNNLELILLSPRVIPLLGAMEASQHRVDMAKHLAVILHPQEVMHRQQAAMAPLRQEVMLLANLEREDMVSHRVGVVMVSPAQDTLLCHRFVVSS